MNERPSDAAAPGPAGLPGFTPAEVPVTDPYPHYHRYRTAAPVHLAADGSYYVFGHAEVAQVLSGRRDYVRGPVPARIPQDCPHLSRTVANWMVFMDPPEHTRVRALVSRSFTPRTVQALRPRIRRIAARLAEQLADTLAGHGEADLVAGFAAPLPVLVISELLGVPERDRDWFRARALDLEQATSSRTGRRADGFALAEAAAGELDAYFRAELRRPGRADRGDLIGLMLRHGAGLSEDTLVGTCVHLLTAGHETTTNLLAKGLLALLAHPGQLAALRSGLLPPAAAVEELVRYDPPVQMITRRARERDVLAGRTIPAGSKLVLVLGSANRDPAHFPHPDRLDLARDTHRHCGFGTGIHYCVGAPLARAEAELGLAALLARIPRPALSTRSAEPLRYARDLVFHGPSRLMLQGD
ncbi:cytochrome P450 [Kitasatospora viridis]|uniref:Cytochrome P450 n=1 Tax=Kitasatospora viridis TaxID=281105 RepID=A0A561SF24_9ACTN|nr:cytochrome P450 [Kitasatospora viridis]TWF73470.1 cytochrome P450 [Kitasatospora viridis]